MTTLKSKNMVLRHIRMSDLHEFVACQSDSIARKLISTQHTLVQASIILRKRVLDLHKKKPHGETFAIEIGDQFVGYIDIAHLHEQDGEHRATIGYCIAKKYRNRGIATQAVKLITAYAFKHYKLKRIEAWLRPENKASAKVLRKNGYVLEGILRKHRCKKGTYYDDMIYAKIQ